VTVELEGVAKVFADGTEALVDLDLRAEADELLVLVGPSGSGKSTVLRIVAGLESPTRGRVFIRGRDVTDLAPQRRDVAMVFQSYALYPHKTVAENVAFPLRVRSVPSEEIRAKVERVTRLLDIADLGNRRPSQLSGGQRQRVALARAIVREPKAFLLDEPLSNLDPTMRQHTRAELARLHRRLGVTTLYVTHDQEEAMTLGDRVAVLRDGRLEQVASPMELYARPLTRFVASFIGSPPMSLFACHLTRAADRVQLDDDMGLHLDLAASAVPQLVGAPSTVIVGIRPHDVERVAGDEEASFRGVVELVEPRGSDVVVRATPLADDAARDGGALVAVLPSDSRIAEGAPFAARFPVERLHCFDPVSGARLA
jgi:multiple sugar transport system ATP-binding protein